MNTIYKIGDKVKIRDDLSKRTEWGGVDVVEGMEQLAGAIGEITGTFTILNREPYEIIGYGISVDEGSYGWSAAMLEKYEEPKKEKTPLDWLPNKGQQYYHIVSLDVERYRWDDDDIDSATRETHRIFKTPEEAWEQLDVKKAKRRVEIEVARLNDGWKPNWKDHEQHKYSFYYAHSTDKFLIRGHFEHQVIGFYLKTEELAEQLIKSHEEDLKLIFGVEDND